jgi:hypothetical protein
MAKTTAPARWVSELTGSLNPGIDNNIGHPND